MKLIIDAGNTKTKAAVFKGDTIIKRRVFDLENLSEVVKNILKQFPEIERAILSSVAALNENELKTVLEKQELIILNHKLLFPFENKYETPNTLGVDRMALVAAAVKNFPQKNCLIIDSGSCLTFDFIDEFGVYYGGAISPGLEMRYKSLNNFTANLPLLKPKSIDKIIGNNTENAIHRGVTHGVITEISGVIEQFSNTYSNLIVILTGGDAEFLSKQLKSSIFVLPNFLMEGLCHILDYNIDK